MRSLLGNTALVQHHKVEQVGGLIFQGEVGQLANGYRIEWVVFNRLEQMAGERRNIATDGVGRLHAHLYAEVGIGEVDDAADTVGREQRSEVAAQLSKLQRVPIVAQQLAQVALAQAVFAHGEHAQHRHAKRHVDEMPALLQDRHEERLGIIGGLGDDFDERVLDFQLLVGLLALSGGFEIGGVEQGEAACHHDRPQGDGRWMDAARLLVEQRFHDRRLQPFAHLGQPFVDELLRLLAREGRECDLVA